MVLNKYLSILQQSYGFSLSPQSESISISLQQKFLVVISKSWVKFLVIIILFIVSVKLRNQKLSVNWLVKKNCFQSVLIWLKYEVLSTGIQRSITLLLEVISTWNLDRKFVSILRVATKKVYEKELLMLKLRLAKLSCL